MTKKICILFIIILLSYNNSFGQSKDTITVLHYNLLYFGLDQDGCNSTNNSISLKINYLKTIVNYTKPDIFAVNEIYYLSNYHDYLLSNVFLLNGFNNYQRASVKGSFLTQQVYYNSNKLVLEEENEIYAYPRNIFSYKFYYKSPDLINGDTVFFTYFNAHLKAGSTDDDHVDRKNAANNLMNHISYISTENYILSGDLNLYNASDDAYQVLTNFSNAILRFNDPALVGEWHENSQFASVHTQSTSYSGDGCKSSGGLDDRFDFILHSNAIKNGTSKMQYIQNSYTIIGQDGNHFNSGINYGGNTSVPATVLTAITNNSDHLPVLSKFLIFQTPASITKNTNKTDNISFNNPIYNTLEISIINNTLLNKNLFLEIYDTQGSKVYSTILSNPKENLSFSISLEFLPVGIYLLNLYTENEPIIQSKFIKSYK